MKSKFVSLAATLCAAALCSSARAEGFFVEAGAGLVVFNDGDYALSRILPPETLADANTVSATLAGDSFTVDDRSAALSVAGGYRFTDWFSLRVGYQHFGRTTTTLVSDVVIAADVDPGTVTTAYADELRVVSFAPEFRWRATPRLALLFSPRLNWVFSDAELRTDSNSPFVLIIPRIKRSADELTIGGGIGAEFALSNRLGLTARYDYLDVDLSWGRQADVWSVGLKYEF